MDISKYTDFFHDGAIFNIQHGSGNIVFFMRSAEMDEDDLEDDIHLSKDDRIEGKLHIDNIKSIAVRNQLFLGELKQVYDRGSIFDFEITKNSVELSIDWVNFPPNPEINDFVVIQIEAEKIWWENIPNLEEQLEG